MKKLIYILLVPAALVVGFFIGRDIELSQTHYWADMTVKVAEVSQKTINNLGEQSQTCLDVLDQKITSKEGEQKLLELHEQYKQIDQEHKALNAELGK